MGKEIRDREPLRNETLGIVAEDALQLVTAELDRRIEEIGSESSKASYRLLGETADFIIALPIDHVIHAIEYVDKRARENNGYNASRVINHLGKGDRQGILLARLIGVPEEEVVRISPNRIFITDDIHMSKVVELIARCSEVDIVASIFERLYGGPSRSVDEEQRSQIQIGDLDSALQLASSEAAIISSSLAGGLLMCNEKVREDFLVAWKKMVKENREIGGTFDLLGIARRGTWNDLNRELADASYQLLAVMEAYYIDGNVSKGLSNDSVGGYTTERHTGLIGKISDFLVGEETCGYFEVNPILPDGSNTGLLSQESLKVRMELLGSTMEELINNAGVSWEIVHFPGGTPFFVFWRGEMGEVEKTSMVREKVTAYLRTYKPENTMRKDLTVEELDTLVENVVCVEDGEAQAKLIAQKYPLSLGGPHGLMTSGHRIPFKLPEETDLRGKGLRSMSIKPIDRKKGGGLEVCINWHGWNALVMLDNHLKIVDDGKISKRSKTWLYSVIYTYVAGIRNPEKGQRVISTEPLSSEDELLEELGKAVEGKKTGRVAHLIVLPIGHRWRRTSQEELEEADITFGVDLELLNEEFLVVQRDLLRLRALDELYRETVKQQLWKVVEKREKPRWPRVVDPDTGRRIESPMVLSKREDGLKRPLYEITYMSEIPVVGFMETNIHGAGALIQA